MYITCTVRFPQQPYEAQTAIVCFVLMRKLKDQMGEVSCPTLQSYLYGALVTVEHQVLAAESHSGRQTDSDPVFEHPGRSVSLKTTTPSFLSCFRTRPVSPTTLPSPVFRHQCERSLERS